MGERLLFKMLAEKRNWKQFLVACAISVAVGSGIGALIGLGMSKPEKKPDLNETSLNENYVILYDGKLGKGKALLLWSNQKTPEYRLKITKGLKQVVYGDIGMDKSLDYYVIDYSRGKGLCTRIYTSNTPECRKAQKEYLKNVRQIEQIVRQKGEQIELFD